MEELNDVAVVIHQARRDAPRTTHVVEGKLRRSSTAYIVVGRSELVGSDAVVASLHT